MAKRQKEETQSEPKKIRPALTPEGRENQMINLAINLAEKQLQEGTASSQIISHYLKLATQHSKIELEKLELEKELVKAKTDSLNASKKSDEMYAEVIKALRSYSGNGGDDEDDEYDDYYYRR